MMNRYFVRLMTAHTGMVALCSTLNGFHFAQQHSGRHSWRSSDVYTRT